MKTKMTEVTFAEDARGNFAVTADGFIVGWLEDAGVWTWLPNRRVREVASFEDKTFGRDFEEAKRFITEQVGGMRPKEENRAGLARGPVSHKPRSTSSYNTGGRGWD